MSESFKIPSNRVITSNPGRGKAHEPDTGFLLPSDDQLHSFVDKLCESIPAMNVKSERGRGTLKESLVESSSLTSIDLNEEIKFDASPSFSDSEGRSNALNQGKLELNVVDKNKLTKTDVHQNSDKKLVKQQYNEKRSLSNNDLNIAIMQCSGSLEMLSEKRKALERLVQTQLNITNISYNVSYSPRLPDSPTRVDRLMYDISRERCRILGLISALEQTITSFSSKNTKDNLRKLLVSFGNAVVEVIKERQSEVAFSQNNSSSNDYDAGVLKLVQLIGRVHNLNRAVYTALWCIEIKEQVGLVLSRTRAGILNCPTNNVRSQKQVGITIQKSWQCMKTSPQQKRSTSASTRPSNFGQQPVWVTQQQTSIYQILPQHKQNRKHVVPTFTQEQRAEIFQHFYSSLKQSI